jgi:2-keto-3-deoxy-L-rhamnonate aldolase RhmA
MTRLEETLQSDGAPIIGTATSNYDPLFVEIVAKLGYRMLWIEMEHSPITYHEAEELCRLASGFGMLSLIRIPDSQRQTVLKAAECSPDIICLAMVNTPETAAELVRHARYGPEGSRGWCTGSRAMGYGFASDPAEQQRSVNERLCLMVQIETLEAVERADQICSVPGINAVFVGLGDLSASMGFVGKMGRPEVVEAANRAISTAKSSGLLAAVPANPTDSGMWAGKGVDILICGSNVHCVRNGAKAILSQAQEGLAESAP